VSGYPRSTAPVGFARARLARSNIQDVRVLAALLALIAVACMTVAIVGMVTGRPGARAGGLLRALALLCFVGAVVLNVLAH
jgi:hypothetical protein